MRQAVSVEPKDQILVVDDNDDTRELMTRLVERDFLDLEVASFAWPSAALEFAGAHVVRLLITSADMLVAKSGGVVRTLREKAPGLPVVVVGIDSAAEERAQEAGADRFVLRSRLAFDLVEVVRALLTCAAG